MYKGLRNFLLWLPIPRSNYFCFFFNFFSLITNSNIKITYKDGFYYIKDLNWQFYHKKSGVYFYQFGIERRINELRQKYLIDHMKFNKDDVIIDCGANNGDFYLCFDKNIKYYGIEPSPIVFSNLEYNIKNQNLINKGLWNESKKEISFYLSDEGGDSSIIPISSYTKKINISTITLDELIDEIGLNIKLIKIEGEGSEPEILEGLKKNLKKVEYLTIDVGFERGVEQKSTYDECKNYLINNNFELINYNKKKCVLLFKNLS
jgi:FkbM family methyltransferase